MHQAIIFDLDDTLISWKAYAHSGFLAVDSWLKSQYSVTGFIKTAWPLFEKGVRHNTLDKAFELLGLPSDEKRNQEALRVYRSHKPSLALFADAAWALPRWTRRYQLGIITDGLLEVQKRKVESLKLDQWMQIIIYTDGLTPPSPKPSSLAFESIMNSLRLPGEACVYVGDNPHKDFLAPKALGWKTVRIRRMGMEHSQAEACSPEYEANFEIESFRQLEANLPELSFCH